MKFVTPENLVLNVTLYCRQTFQPDNDIVGMAMPPENKTILPFCTGTYML